MHSMRRVWEAELPATLCVPEDIWETYSCLHGPTALNILGTKTVELRLFFRHPLHTAVSSRVQWMSENLTDEATSLNP
jgi:hypothetical protein